MPDVHPEPTASTTEVTDPRAMRALAHPLRLELLDLLAVEGTATATRCAEALGESQASCSFHLRQLAKYGFVEEAEPASWRERPWRLTSVSQRWSSVQADPAGTLAAAQLARCSWNGRRPGYWPGTGPSPPGHGRGGRQPRCRPRRR